MSSVKIPTTSDLLLSTASPRLREPTLHSSLDDLRAIARSLLTQLESLRLPVELGPEGGLNLDDELKRYEIGLIRAALDKADGSQTRAARMLGVKVTTLNTKIKRYQIKRYKCLSRDLVFDNQAGLRSVRANNTRTSKSLKWPKSS